MITQGSVGAGKTSVSRLIQKYLGNTVIVEVDDIKINKYGTTEKVNHIIDYTSAALSYKLELEKGLNVILIEPFNSKEYIDLVLNIVELKEDNQKLIFIWLQCRIKTSLQRKGKAHSEKVIQQQINKHKKRYIPKKELFIKTDTISIKNVFDQIIQYIE